jgi:hypothetical protein
VRVANGKNARCVFQFWAKFFDALRPAKERRAEEDKGILPHPFVLVVKVGVNHRALRSQPLLE